MAACLLLVVGMGAGSLGGYEYRAGPRRPCRSAERTQIAAAHSAGPPVGRPADVASISSIVQQPNSEIVEVRYNQVVPQQIEGSLDDPAIRQLLMMASEDASLGGRFATTPWVCWRPSAAPATVAMPPAFATRSWWRCATTRTKACARRR